MRARGPRALLALLVTGAAGALGVGALAASAHAAGSCLGPCSPTMVVNGMDADGTVHVTYSDTSGNGLNGFDPASLGASIAWAGPAKLPPGAPAPNPSSDAMVNPMCSSGPNPITCTFSFPPSMMVNSDVLNGTYSVTPSGQDCILSQLSGCTAAPSAPKQFTLANPPTAPTGVKAVAQGSTAKVTWAPSPEPDVVGYDVLRDGTVFCRLASFPAPTEYACIDTPAKDGSYTYSVVAHRWGPGYSVNPKDQPASAPTAAPKAVSVTGTASNPTTTVPATLGPKGFVPTLTPKKGPAPAGPTIRLGPGGTSPAIGANTPTTPDPGFAPTLPYGAPPPSDPGTTNPAAISAPAAAPHKGQTSVGTIAVIGAGLLIAVIALHGLWLRSEVRRVPILEVLDPEH